MVGLSVIGYGVTVKADQAATVTAGSSLSISVTAAGTAPFTYQWGKNGGNIGTNAATYAIANASLADAGLYTVVVSNSAGSVTSDVATLTIDTTPAAPTITTQPTSQAVTAGQPASFTVGASGSPTLSYQWTKDGFNIIGANSPTYTITSAQVINAGSYSVIVSGSVTPSATSSPATLTVSAFAVAPTITVQPQSSSVAQGATASYTVVATGSATLSYQWSKDGTPLAGQTSSTSLIPNAQVSNAGNYSVVVSNSANPPATSTVATLTVSPIPVAPVITTQPANKTINQGGAAIFTVGATGTSPVGYQWRKNSISIPNALSSTYAIPSAQFTDAANYSVVVSNLAGSVTSSNAALTVNAVPAAPTITTPPRSRILNVGYSVTFSVTASGAGPLGYQWKKDNIVIPNALSASYTINSLSLGDGGSYSVVVSNIGGSVTSNPAVLTIDLSIFSASDFDANRRSEPLWKNFNTGEIKSWFYSGGSRGYGFEGGGWQVIGAGDFDGDGKTEPLWRDSVSSMITTWFYAGGSRNLISEGGGWVFIGVGDFDGDGQSEPLMRNTITFELRSWVSSGGSRSLNTETGGWQFIYIGDFDGDRLSEPLMLNSSTQEIRSWLSSSGYVGSRGFGSQGGGWTVIGVGDFDGDGLSEPLWRNSGTGAIVTWFYAGGSLILGSEGGGWQVIDVGDFDGDGRSEPLWRNSITGEIRTWFASGGSYGYGNEGGGWQVIHF